MNRFRILCYLVPAVCLVPCLYCDAGQKRPDLGSFVPDDPLPSESKPVVQPPVEAKKSGKKKVAPPAIEAQKVVETVGQVPVAEQKVMPVKAPDFDVSPLAKLDPVAAPPVKEPLVAAQLPAIEPAVAKDEVVTPQEALVPESDLTGKKELFSDEAAKSVFEATEDEEVVEPQERTKPAKKTEPMIVIKKNEKLSSFIEKIAVKKGVNVIMPHGADIIKETITFDTPQKLPLSQAMSYLYMFMGMTGYRVRPDNGFFIISRVNENNISREPLPFFVNVSPDKLPTTDVQIRAIYYLANFRVPGETGGNDPLNLILKDMLGSQKVYFFDRKTNAIILVGPSRKIAAAMKLIINLDSTGEPDDLQVIPLYNAPAPTVAKLLNEQIIATAQDPRRSLRNDTMAQEDFYFAPNTRVVADPRTNSLIVLGQGAAVQRIRDLVKDYIDLPPESGRSVLHVYDLQYLKSRELAEQLTKIVSGGDSEQSRKETGGPQKFFEEVKIIPEEIEDAPVVGSGSKITTRSSIGGNRLIIAATNDDWLQIKSLIEQLDKPEYQVILEVMVVDLTVSANKALKSQTRNPKFLDLPSGFQFQTAQMYTQILNGDTAATSTTLAADLLRLIKVGDVTESLARAETSGDDIGAMIISLRDPNTDSIWSVLSLLDKWTERKVLSHPFLITRNNYTAHEVSDEIRRNLGPIVENNSTVTTVKYKDYEAKLRVDITPRISSVDRLNLQVKVTVENFLDATGQNKATREVETNASLGSGQILVIGGLSAVTDSDAQSGWPLLSRLPIIGNLFRASTEAKTRSNLAIFIHPTVIDPKLRSGMNKYTAENMKKAERMFDDTYLFSAMRDPITRIFLSEPKVETAQEIFEQYNRESASKPKPDSLDTVAFNVTSSRDLEELKARMQGNEVV